MNKAKELLLHFCESEMVGVDVGHPEMMKVLSKTPSGINPVVGNLRLKALKDLLKKQNDQVELYRARGKFAYIVDHPGSVMEIPLGAVQK